MNKGTKQKILSDFSAATESHKPAGLFNIVEGPDVVRAKIKMCAGRRFGGSIYEGKVVRIDNFVGEIRLLIRDSVGKYTIELELPVDKIESYSFY